MHQIIHIQTLGPYRLGGGEMRDLETVRREEAWVDNGEGVGSIRS